MKVFGLIAAGLLGAMAVAPASASAAPVASATTLTTAGVAVAGQAVVRDRHDVRRGPQARRGHHGRWATRRVCTNRWQHGRKIRSCKNVRYRR